MISNALIKVDGHADTRESGLDLKFPGLLVFVIVSNIGLSLQNHATRQLRSVDPIT